jgi:hypothetical protein
VTEFALGPISIPKDTPEELDPLSNQADKIPVLAGWLIQGIVTNGNANGRRGAFTP